MRLVAPGEDEFDTLGKHPYETAGKIQTRNKKTPALLYLCLSREEPRSGGVETSCSRHPRKVHALLSCFLNKVFHVYGKIKIKTTGLPFRFPIYSCSREAKILIFSFVV